MEISLNHRPNYNWTLILAFILAVIAILLMSSCNIAKKVKKTDTKTTTETKAVTTQTTASTESTSVTRTIVEEFTDTLTTPTKTTSIVKENKILQKGDTIKGDSDGFIIKEYVNDNGKVVTEIKTKSSVISVPKKKTTIESVSSVKSQSATSQKKEDIKTSVHEKTKDLDKKTTGGLNLNYLWWLLLLLIIPILKYRKYLF